MKSKDINILAEVFCSVIERESFMFGYAIDKNTATPSDSMQKASLTFTGEKVSGSISLVLPESLSLELAANMLGAEPEEEFVQEQSKDALGELLNVLCGQFLTTVEGEIPIFDLTVPVVTSIDNSEWENLLKHELVSLLMVEDEHNVLLSLNID